MPPQSSHASAAGAAIPTPASSPAAPGRLPVWRTVRDSYAFVLRRQGALARLAAPWLLAGLAVGYGGARLGQGELGWTAASLVDSLGGAALTVAWLRHATVDAPAGWGAPLDAGVASLLGRSLGVALLCLLPGAVLTLLGGRLVADILPGDAGRALAVVVMAAVGSAALYALLRLQLYVVAGALRFTSLDPAAAWRAMAGQTARLAAVYLAVSMLGIVVGTIGIALGAGLVLGLLGPGQAPSLVLPSDGGAASGPSLLIEALVRTLGYALAGLNATVLAALVRHVLPAAITSPPQ